MPRREPPASLPERGGGPRAEHRAPSRAAPPVTIPLRPFESPLHFPSDAFVEHVKNECVRDAPHTRRNWPRGSAGASYRAPPTEQTLPAFSASLRPACPPAARPRPRALRLSLTPSLLSGTRSTTSRRWAYTRPSPTSTWCARPAPSSS